jgi:hypothetical protein
VPHAQQLGHIAELREARLHPKPRPVGGQLEVGGDLTEGGGPGVEVGQAGGVEQIGAQEPLHRERFADAVGDRGGGGEGGHAAAVPLTQVVQLHIQVRRALGAFDADALDVGDGAQVLIAVSLVDFTDRRRLDAPRFLRSDNVNMFARIPWR